MSRLLSLALLVPLLSAGCTLLPADGTLWIEGSLVSTEGKALSGCVVRIPELDDSQEITPRFKTSFAVAPTRHVYKLYFKCLDHKEIQSSASIQDDPLENSKLGTLVLEPDFKR